MPKYVEIKDKEGQLAGYVMDYENGYKEVHDKNGQPSAYVYDQEKMNAAILEGVEEYTKDHSGSGWPSIEEDGRIHCFIVYGYRIARFVIPLTFLFAPASFIPAALCFFLMWPIEIYWHYIASEFFDGPQAWASHDKHEKRRAFTHIFSAAFITLQVLFVLYYNFF